MTSSISTELIAGKEGVSAAATEDQALSSKDYTRSLELIKICEFGEMSRPDGQAHCREQFHHIITSRV